MESHAVQKTDTVEVELLHSEAATSQNLITFGWYPIFFFIMCILIGISATANMQFINYAGSEVIVDGCDEINFNDEGDRCKNLHRFQLEENCVPRLKYQFGSLNLEFHLYCSQLNIRELVSSLEAIGALVGFVLSGQLADTFGRKWVLFVALTASALSSLATSHLDSLESISLTRAITSFFNSWIFVVCPTFGFESVPSCMRLLILSVLCLTGSVVVPWLALFAQEWRTYLKFVAVLQSGAAFLVVFSCESVFFNLQKGKWNAARRGFQKIHYVNGTLNSDTVRRIDSVARKEKRTRESNTPAKCLSILHCCGTPYYAFWTSILITLCSLLTLITSSITLQQENLHRLLYFHAFYNSSILWVVMIVYIIMDVLISRLGRKHIISSSCITSIVCLIVSMETEAFRRPKFLELILHTSLIVLSQIAFVSTVLLACELYPTGVRATIISLCYAVPQLVMMFSPKLHSMLSIASWLPSFSFAVLLLVLLISVHLYLPETKETPIQLHFLYAGRSCCTNKKPSTLNIESSDG